MNLQLLWKQGKQPRFSIRQYSGCMVFRRLQFLIKVLSLLWVLETSYKSTWYSTSFYPERNWLTQQANAIIKQYLQHFCNYHWDNWAELLPTTEFAANNTHSISISYTLFLANSRQHLRLGFEPISALKNATVKTKRELVDANEFVIKMENVCQELQNYMLLT